MHLAGALLGEAGAITVRRARPRLSPAGKHLAILTAGAAGGDRSLAGGEPAVVTSGRGAPLAAAARRSRRRRAGARRLRPARRDAPHSRRPARLRVAALPFLVYAPSTSRATAASSPPKGSTSSSCACRRRAASLAALAADQVDVIAERPSVALLAALAAGQRLAAVADLNHVDPQGCVRGGILARPELAADLSPAALVGRRIEMDRAGIENFLLDQVLAPIGRTSADVEAVDLDDPAIGEALASGAVDFAFTSEPWSSELVRSGRAVVWRPLQRIAPDFQLAFVLYGPRLLDREPEIGERFLAAYLRAVATLADGPAPEDSARLARELGLAPSRLEALCPTPVRRDGALSSAGLVDFQRWALALGLLERPAPLERFAEPRFAAAFAGGRR